MKVSVLVLGNVKRHDSLKIQFKLPIGVRSLKKHCISKINYWIKTGLEFQFQKMPCNDFSEYCPQFKERGTNEQLNTNYGKCRTQTEGILDMTSQTASEWLRTESNDRLL
jgi:hypothetical protein